MYSHITVQSKSWKKEINDLFDFETQDIVHKHIQFPFSKQHYKTYIISQDNDVYALKHSNSLINKVNDYQQFVIHLEIRNNNNYNICEPSISVINPYRSLYLRDVIEGDNNVQACCIMKSWIHVNTNEERKVNVGDIIKIGRVRLKIDVIHLLQSNICNSNNVNKKMMFKDNVTTTNLTKTNNTLNDSMYYNCIKQQHNNNTIDIVDQQQQQQQLKVDQLQMYCRICYRSENDLTDPLISPCKCSGSMGYIHYKCLKKSIEMKITRKEDQKQLMIQWKSFECEICRVEYPKYLKYKHSLYPMIDLNIPFNEFILCDYMVYDDSIKKTQRKGLIVISFDYTSNVQIGRNQNCVVRLTDITVSRTHCVLKRKDDNCLYVVDQGSKFGTMMYMNKDIVLNCGNESVNVCSGKHWFNIGIKKSWSLFGTLFRFGCCRCNNYHIESECVVGMDVCSNKCITEDNNNNNNIEKKNSDNDNEDKCDSYDDYVMNIDKFIYSNNKNGNDM